MRSNVVSRVFPKGMAVPGLGGQDFGGATPVPPVSPTPTPTASPTPTSTPQPTPTPTPSATPPVVFETEYQAVLDYATTQGYTLPSYSTQLLQNTLVGDLKSNGNWTDMDIMYVPAGDGDEDFATINWIDPDGSFNIDILGGITYSGNTGYKGNDTNGVLNTNFTPFSRARGNNDDVSMGGWFLGVEGALMGCVNFTSFGVGHRQHILSSTPTDFFYGAYLASTVSPNAGAIATTDGLWVTDNDGSSNTRLFRNDTQIFTAFDGGVANLGVVPLAILGRRNGGTYDFYSNSNCLFAFHGARNAKDGLYTIIGNYISAL
jgi:hypothetical protein